MAPACVSWLEATPHWILGQEKSRDKWRVPRRSDTIVTSSKLSHHNMHWDRM